VFIKDPAWQVAIFGTFDVENYGDLLFPVIAQAQLTQRLGAVELHRFSYNAKSPPHWPYTVTSVNDLPEVAAQLDGVLIGGGFIIRFDKVVAHGYMPPNSGIHHPTGYWLSPALIAHQHGVPVIWNAPGMHCNDIPEWGKPLLKMALEYSPCIRVRDEPSRKSLNGLSPAADIQVLPDTAFGLPDLIDEQHPSKAFAELREAYGLDKPYIVIQPIHVVEPLLQLFEKHPQVLSGYRLLVLPIGPVLGDHPLLVSSRIPGTLTLPFWPAPLLLAEILGHAQAVIGHSYHLAISALVFGVPVFSTADLSTGKYTALANMAQMHALPQAEELTEHWFRSRLGKREPSAAITAMRVELASYWDHVATIITQGKTTACEGLNRFWQYLPTLLENGNPSPAPSIAASTPTLDFLNIELNARQQQIYQLTEQLTAMQNSNSYKLTAPLRSLRRGLSKWRAQ